MKPIVLNGNIWRVIRVMPGDPYLVDRTGIPRIAVTDVANKMIGISWDVLPPLLDRVLLHEIGHIENNQSWILGRVMRRGEEEYYATMWALDIAKEYSLIIPKNLIKEYVEYVQDEIDRGRRRGGTSYRINPNTLYERGA